MAEWSNNNLACGTLWMTLFTMNQLESSFKTSGELTMSDLGYFNPSLSSDALQTEVVMVADHLDNVFRHVRGARYEEDVDHSGALSGMITILSDEDKTLSELAEKIDESYLFWGE